MTLGLILMAAAIASSATAFAAPQATNSSQNIKRIQYLIDHGQVDAAEKQLWEIITREPENAPAIDLLGAIRTRQKRFLEAEAHFKRVLAIKPDFVPSYRSLGQLYVVQGRREDAKIAYQKVLELEPRDAKTILALGTIYEETNEFERSIETINSIPTGLWPSAALTPLVRRGAASDPSVVPRFARVLVENGFVDDAQELLQTAAPHQKVTPEYLMVLARVQEGQGDLSLAGRTLARVAQMDPHSFDALFQSARLASLAKEYKKEAGLLDKALEIQPDDLEALRHLVLALMRSG